MNIQKQFKTIRSYGTPSIFNGTNLWIPKNVNEETPNSQPDYHWFYNGLDSGISANDNGSNPFAPVNNVQLYSSDNFQRNLELLDARINTIHKELSYWDLYKITTAVLIPTSLPAVISSLAVGESAVINCETFTYNQETYHRGDVIVKVSDTKELFIPAENTGIYKPVSPVVPYLSNGSVEGYQITYSYMSGQPNSTERIVDLNVPLSSDSVTYGNTYIFDINNYSEDFSTYTFNNNPIKPVIKTFILISDIDYEEIIIDDMSVTYNNGKWTVSIPSTMFNENISKIYVQVK